MAWTKEKALAYNREYRRGLRRRKPNVKQVDLSRVPYGISPEFRFFAKVKLS